MHSTLVRVQNVFGYFTSVAFAVAGIIALSVLLSPQSPSASLQMRNVQVVKGRPHYYSTKKEEYAHIKFDLDADLTSLFSWNTKQVFAYVVATFPGKTPDAPDSEAIIWDAIIPSPSEPWHANTYIHPAPKKSSTTASSKSRSSKSKKSSGKAQAYPQGTAPGILSLSNQKPKYQVTTPWSRLGGAQNVTLHLRYNIQPWVGALTWSSPRDRGLVWKGLQGESSAAFEFPRVKQPGDASASKSLREELKTETGGERNRGSPA